MILILILIMWCAFSSNAMSRCLIQCSGLVLIALGIWLLVLLAQSDGIVDMFKGAYGSSFFRNAAILLIAMGCLILFVTVLGLVAAIRESKILLTIVSNYKFNLRTLLAPQR